MAWVTSTTMAACGSTPEGAGARPAAGGPDLLLRGPHRDGAGAGGGAAASRRSASSTTNAPMRLSMLREAMRPLGSSSAAQAITPASPTRTRSSASFLFAAPMSIHRSVILRDLVLLVGLDQVDRLLPDHPGHRPAAALEDHPLAHQHLAVPAADGAEVDEAVVVHVHDHHADLVHVAGEHHARACRRG